ncbi:MAG: hypothetical protein QG608_41 [Actinomycetota bacterium]|nr:hypothetical protein [Actinomycetota bacterium]
MAESPTHIRFAADVLRRLGEELNPSVDQGIVELVKNAYDANACECVVELYGVEAVGGRVTVRDDGDGMTRDQVVDGWLVLGRSSKSISGKTRLGRTPAGSKGLGRLAALRMGRSVTLTTCPLEQQGQRHELTIDWDRYDQADVVERVPLSITTTPDTSPPGTLIQIDDLRHPIGRQDVRRLARTLLLLADPFENAESSFRPRLIAEEFQDLSRLVEARYFSECEFHLRAVVDEWGRASAQVLDGYDEVLWSADHENLTGDSAGRYKCPPAEFDVWVFVLAAETFKLRTVSLGEVREWLRHFGGIHVYVNGLRVAPYGNQGNDWLDINLARARSPEARPSTNTTIGRIQVDDPGDRLQQKTDRSGLIEGPAFHDLRKFATDALEFMAARRLAETERRRQQERSTTKSTSVGRRAEVHDVIASVEGPKKLYLEKVFERYDGAREKQVDALRREVDLYRTLSTAGITAATFAHESAGSPVKILGQALSTIERRGLGKFGQQFIDLFTEQFRSMRRAIASIAVLGSVTLSLLEAEKRRQRRVEVVPVIEEVVTTLGPFFSQREVEVDLDLSEERPFLHGARSSVESILTNLLNNSLTAFESSHADRRYISITMQVEGAWSLISLADNGPGIQGIGREEIWLPGQTTKQHGTGLGLTIVKDSVTDLGGSVEVLSPGRLGGAEFNVKLPVLGA